VPKKKKSNGGVWLGKHSNAGRTQWFRTKESDESQMTIGRVLLFTPYKILARHMFF